MTNHQYPVMTTVTSPKRVVVGAWYQYHPPCQPFQWKKSVLSQTDFGMGRQALARVGRKSLCTSRLINVYTIGPNLLIY